MTGITVAVASAIIFSILLIVRHLPFRVIVQTVCSMGTIRFIETLSCET